MSDQVTLEDLDNAPETLQRADTDYRRDYEAIRQKWIDVTSEKVHLEAQNVRLKSKLETKRELDRLIAPYAGKAYWFMCLYSLGVGCMVVLHGFRVQGFSLPSQVMQFLVGSTAATVIGLVGMVLTGVFIGSRYR